MLSIDNNLTNSTSECCLYEEFGSCNTYVSNRFNDWSPSLINICDLKDNMAIYLAKIGVVPKSNQGSFDISECDLILNRLARYVDVEKPYLKICPLHRYTYGIGWRDNGVCAHLDHQESYDFLGKKSKKKSLAYNRVARFHLVRHLVKFPYGGRLCASHLKEAYAVKKDRESVADELNAISELHSYEIEMTKRNDLDNTNIILSTLDQSPVKFQTEIPLEEQAASTVRRLTAKLRRSVSVTASSIAEGMAPGQGEKLIELANLNFITDRRSSNTSTSSYTSVDEQYLEYLMKMYQSYEEKGFPFNEQVRVLSLIPESWNLTSTFIQEKFNCSNYAVKTARRLNRITNTPLHIEERIPKIRQRLDPEKIDYFISWIVESHLLVSIPWGNTNLKLDNGQKISIPRQMLEASHGQIVYQYHQHCAETGIESLSSRTVYSILETLQASEQKSRSGIDDFVKAAAEGFLLLEQIIQQLPTTRDKKNELNSLLQENKIYLKSKYEGHCGEEEQSITHCTIFALSQANDPFYSQACKHVHDVICKDCILITEMFDKIEDCINEINDYETKGELSYDFHLAWDSVFQLMSHRVRAAQQEQQKEKYLNEMDEATALLTIDWSQKILPQQFREGQNFYFGKKGMSLLVGSFVFNQPRKNEKTSQTYMLAFTTCSQTEHETLAGGKLILEQFHHDYPHISKLIKRSDNASVLAGHCTLHHEKIICDSLGIKLVMRDYSEIQCGKSICDRLSGSAKLRMRAYINSGHDVLNGTDIKKGIEYGGGVRNVQIGVAEVLQTSEKLSKKHIPEISSIRNIIYDDKNIFLRKATGVGVGRPIGYENLRVVTGVTLVEPFEKSKTIPTASLQTATTTTKRNDRMFRTFIFCPNESCITTFESEEDLENHIALNEHTTRESCLRTKDKAKLMLFEKIKSDQASSSNVRSSAIPTTTTGVSRHYKLFEKEGWALRVRKPSRRIDIDVKAYIKSLFEEEKVYGRKIPIEEYIKRIRTARNPDGTKTFNPNQYLTYNQVSNQIKMLSQTRRKEPLQVAQRISRKRSEEDDAFKQPVKQQLSFLKDDVTDILSAEEDEEAVTQAIWLEKLKKIIIDADVNS